MSWIITGAACTIGLLALSAFIALRLSDEDFNDH